MDNPPMPPADPITLEFTYTYDDFTGHSRDPLHARIPFTWHQLILWAAVISVAVFLFSLFGGRDQAPAVRTPISLTGTLATFAVPLIAVAALVISLAVQSRRARKQWNTQSPAPIRLTLSPAGLLWEIKQTQQPQAWTAYQSVSESAKAFLLKPLEGPELPLPKRVMTPEQIPAIRQLLQDSITNARGFQVENLAPAPQVQNPETPQ